MNQRITYKPHPETTLNEIMEFDHVIQVHDDGSITDTHGLHAPELVDSQLHTLDWEFFTKGYSGQHAYDGPIMHDSEYIGGRLEHDIRNAPGVYVAIVGVYTTDPDGNPCEDESYIEGWAVARYKHPYPDPKGRHD